MDGAVKWIAENQAAAVIIGGVLFDTIRGAIPDKWDRYKGVTRRALRFALNLLEK